MQKSGAHEWQKEIGNTWTISVSQKSMDQEISKRRN